MRGMHVTYVGPRVENSFSRYFLDNLNAEKIFLNATIEDRY
jgi:hypothetical protein